MKLKYKSAKALGIKPKERRILIDLWPLLINNKVGFDMESSCGTVCCIGGHMAIALAPNHLRKTKEDLRRFQDSYVCSAVRDERYNSSAVLQKLFFPDGLFLRKILRRDAVLASVDFLTTGDPQWDLNTDDDFKKERAARVKELRAYLAEGGV